MVLQTSGPAMLEADEIATAENYMPPPRAIHSSLQFGFPYPLT